MTERFHIWTMAEILAQPEFGNDDGWFYGLVRNGKRLRLAEILPGIGWCVPFWRDVIRHPPWMLRDLRRQRPKPPYSTTATNATTITVGINTASTNQQIWPPPTPR